MNMLPCTKAPRLPNIGFTSTSGASGTRSANRARSASVGLGICTAASCRSATCGRGRGTPGRCPGRSALGLVEAHGVALAVLEPGRPAHALHRGDPAVPLDARQVVDLEGDPLALEVAHLRLDVVDVPLGDGVPGLAGVAGLVDVEPGAAGGLVDQVRAELLHG